MKRLIPASAQIALTAFLIALFLALPLLNPPAAEAVIVYRSASSAAALTSTISYRARGNVVTANNGNITIPLPGAVLGELFVCQVESHDNVPHTISSPAGWNQLYSLTGSANHRASLFWKVSDVTETNPVVTHPGGSNIIARCLRFRGVDPVSPFDATFASNYAASSATVSTGSLTTTAANTMLLFAANLAADVTVTTPTGWSNGFSNNTTNARISLNYRPQAAIATVGPYSANAGSLVENHGILMALSPAATMTLNKPAGTIAGDVMVAAIATTPSTIPITPPAGWTLIQSRQQTANTTSVLTSYYRVAGASEPTTYSWLLSSGHGGAVGGILSFSGVDNLAPIDVSASAATPSSTSHVAPSVTTTAANDMLVTIHEYASGRSWTPPPGMTERVDIPSRINNNSGVTLEMNTLLLGAAGATGSKTAVASASADAGATVTLALRPALAILHHLRIEHDGLASTCAAEPIIVKACANAGCTAPHYTLGDVTNINLAPTGGTYTWSPGSTVSILAANGGISSGFTLVRTNSGTATLAISGAPIPAPIASFECYNTATGLIGDCSLVFSSSSFSFNVPDHVAETRQVVTVTSCSGDFANTNRLVKFWSSYDDPVTGTLPGKVVAGSGNVDCVTGYAALGTAQASATALTLAFGSGATPQATFSLCYPDVGGIRLDSRYDGSNTNTPKDNGVVILGNDLFVARPDHFTLSGIKRSSDGIANPGAVDASSPVFVKAGDSLAPAARFTATVAAKNARDIATPNFGREISPEGIEVTAGLVAPVGGNVGLLTCKGSAADCVIPGGPANFSGGATTVTDLAWNDVGISTLTPSLADGDYLGAGNAIGTTSGNIGRFTPDHFITTVDSSGTLLPPCNNFAYSGQPFGYDPTDLPTVTISAVTAVESGETVTQNYRGSFVKLTNPITQIVMPAVTSDSSNLGLDGVTPLALIWTPAPPTLTANDDGTLELTLNNDQFTYLHNNNARIPPVISDIELKVTAISDSDGIVASDLPAILNPIGSEIRFGRIRLTNSYGSELLDLAMPLRAESIDASGRFVLNSDDTCSDLSLALASVPGSGTVTAGDTCVQDSGAPGASGAGCVAPGPVARLFVEPPSGGSFNLWLQAPGGGKQGSIAVTATVANWLRFDWNGDGTLDHPAARATFGIFKGSPALIYRRESLP